MSKVSDLMLDMQAKTNKEKNEYLDSQYQDIELATQVGLTYTGMEDGQPQFIGDKAAWIRFEGAKEQRSYFQEHGRWGKNYEEWDEYDDNDTGH